MNKIATCVWTLLGLVFLVPACGADADDLPPVYQCQGKALACASRSLTQCKLGADCQIGGTCGGTPASCSSLSGVDCLGQQGCMWTFAGTTESCSGVPKPCSDQKSEFDCSETKGCSWTQACTGDNPSCAALSQNDCKLISGCTWKQIN